MDMIDMNRDLGISGGVWSVTFILTPCIEQDGSKCVCSQPNSASAEVERPKRSALGTWSVWMVGAISFSISYIISCEPLIDQYI